MEKEVSNLNVKQRVNPYEGDYLVTTYYSKGFLNEPKKLEEVVKHIKSKQEFDTILEDLKLFNDENKDNHKYQRLSKKY